MDATSQEPGDENLVRDALEGDDDAFALLVRRHKSRIFAIAARFIRDAHELDDVCQEIFIKAYRRLGSFRGDAPFAHWLARVAVHACHDRLRRARRIPVALPFENMDVASGGDDGGTRAREILGRALERLAPSERMVIVLLELEEYSVREVAALTGWSESNVKVRAFRARQALKAILEGEGHES